MTLLSIFLLSTAAFCLWCLTTEELRSHKQHQMTGALWTIVVAWIWLTVMAMALLVITFTE